MHLSTISGSAPKRHLLEHKNRVVLQPKNRAEDEPFTNTHMYLSFSLDFPSDQGPVYLHFVSQPISRVIAGKLIVFEDYPCNKRQTNQKDTKTIR